MPPSAAHTSQSTSRGEERHSWQRGQAATGLLLEGSIPEVLGCCFPLVSVISVGATAVGAALVSSFPEEKIPAAELTRVVKARPGGE